MDGDASTVTSPRQDAMSVCNVGAFSESRFVDPTPLVRDDRTYTHNGPFEYSTNSTTLNLSMDLYSLCALSYDGVAV